MTEPDDSDSTVGSSLRGSTTSLGSSDLEFPEENGRTYHAYKKGKYRWPNDEQERDRLDLQHHLFGLTFDGRLFICPIDEKKGNIHRVLDVGTGTGLWALDFGDSYPEAHVIGIDLSPIQPIDVAPNVQFEVDDLEEPWTFSHKFDFIHSRMMTGSFRDWPRFFEQSLEKLRPGGYIEIADICFPVQSCCNPIPEDSALRKWSDLMLEAAEIAGRPIDSARSYKSQLEIAGFTNVEEVIYEWPQNPWPDERKFKELGLWNLENTNIGLEGFSMAPFTRALGWTKQEVEVFSVGVRNEMKDKRIHAYWPIYVVYGQKPEQIEFQ